MRVKRGLRASLAASKEAAYYKDDVADIGEIPTDPYFPLQWYLRNTGQNGGKVRLDLNVQAAWDQGITGKNVTTAIMDDGVDYMHPDLKYNYVSVFVDCGKISCRRITHTIYHRIECRGELRFQQQRSVSLSTIHRRLVQ